MKALIKIIIYILITLILLNFSILICQNNFIFGLIFLFSLYCIMFVLKTILYFLFKLYLKYLDKYFDVAFILLIIIGFSINVIYIILITTWVNVLKIFFYFLIMIIYFLIILLLIEKHKNKF